jgi:cell division protein FtsA
VYYEIKSSGYENKLIGGIVITGGGAQLKHLVQLVEYITGIDCRIGFPNEYLAKNEVLPKALYEELKSPLYATSIGLLMKGIQAHEDEAETRKAPKVVKKDIESVKEVGEQQQKEHGLLTWFKKLMKDGNEIDDATFLDKK